MLFPVFVLLSILQISLCVDLTYTVDEGKPPDTLVGDIAVDTQNWESFMPRHPHQLTFNILQGATRNSELFQISKKTGKLYTTKTIDAENMCEYYVECFKMVDVVVQKDDITTKVLEVKIIINDINDHQPEFPEKQISIEFDEGTKETKSIPNAIDKDVGKKNSMIYYQLKENKNEPFILIVSKNPDGTDKLEISLKDKLDREIKDSYLIQVIAKDGGSPSKESILDVHISVIDVNDNAPVFSKNVYNVTIKNELSKISPIVTLSATDLDSDRNGRITYHFSFQTSTMLKTHFKLKESTGEIFLYKNFSQDQRLTYKLYVKATDSGSPPLSARSLVLVNIINEKNNPPIIKVNIFSSSERNTVEISEDIKVGSFIAYVKVTDNDPGENGEVGCELKHHKFQLRNLGSEKYEVIVKKALDRETEAKHEIIISCQDKGSPPLQSKSKFSIQVTDVNDVRPQFSMETFKFFIEENQKSRFSVGFINATDPDLGLGGKLTYSLLTNKKQKFLPFKIQNDGRISAIMPLDYEFQNIYKFQIFVEDNGIPSLNNTVNVIVEVTDKNDNAPYFTFPSVNPYNMNVVYYQHHSKNITQLKASDSDSQENAFLKYEIIRGNSKQIFSMNQYTGLLSSIHVLSQQDAGSYEMEFLVKDSGSPVLSARTTVYLTLTISNKTSEMLNAVNIKKDNKIHLTSAIIIVSVAVMIAVIITVSISVCILHCIRQRNMAYQKQAHTSNRSVHEQKHLIGPSYHGNTWHHVPLTTTNDPCRPKNGCFSCLRRASYSSSDSTLQVSKSFSMNIKI